MMIMMMVVVVGLTTVPIPGPVDTANHPAPQRHAEVTPAASMRSFPQWHFPPRPRKTERHSDITNIIWPHGVPQTRYNNVTPSLVDAANHPAPKRHAEFTPASFPSPSATDSRKRTLNRGCTKPHGTATSQTYFGHTACHRLDTTMLCISI